MQESYSRPQLVSCSLSVIHLSRNMTFCVSVESYQDQGGEQGEEYETEEQLQARILTAALEFVPQHGWSMEAIAAGAEVSCCWNEMWSSVRENSQSTKLAFCVAPCNISPSSSWEPLMAIVSWCCVCLLFMWLKIDCVQSDIDWWINKWWPRALRRQLWTAMCRVSVQVGTFCCKSFPISLASCHISSPLSSLW